MDDGVQPCTKLFPFEACLITGSMLRSGLDVFGTPPSFSLMTARSFLRLPWSTTVKLSIAGGKKASECRILKGETKETSHVRM